MAKKHAKIGKKPGKPAFRTPSNFKYKKSQSYLEMAPISSLIFYIKTRYHY